MQNFKFRNRRYIDKHPDHISGVRKVTASPHIAHKRSKLLIAIISIALVVAIGSIVALIIIANKAPQKNDEVINKNINDAVKTLGADAGGSNFSKRLTVQSSLGFSLTYDPAALDARGQVTDASSTSTYVTGLTYEENDLSEIRDYSLVKIFPPDDQNNTFSTRSGLSVVTNIRKSFWNTRVNPGESKIDALVRYSNSSYTAANGYTISAAEDITINDVTYKKVVRTYAKKYGDLEIKSQDIGYLTVQNDRPYIITITNAKPSNFDQTKVFESVISTLEYGGFDATKLSISETGNAVLAATTEDALNKDVSNVPYDIDSSSVFNVILKNQPSVVRIATVRCADLGLPSKTGQVITTLKNACIYGIGSGSIVSKDGYIATNGHVVSLPVKYMLLGYIGLAESEEETTTNFRQVLQYLRQAGYLSDASLTDLQNQYRSGKIDANQLVEAIVKIVPEKDIKLSNDEVKYSIQLGTDAMKGKKVNGKYVVSLTNTITDAKLIAQNYNDELNTDKGYVFGSGTASDVALLKMNGTNFPTVKTGNISGLRSGSKITAIGYPGFVDGGLQAKGSKTKPTVTQGQVIEVGNESPQSSNKLIVTDVPIAQGNSGGPAFDNQGLQIGLNTYGEINCDDGNCFGDGIARDVADFTTLAQKNNVRLDSSSKISDAWSKGLDAYLKGDFKGAVKGFKSIQKDYPAHYLAARMQSLAESKIGSPEDRSDEYESKTGLAVIVLGAIAIVVIAGGGLVLYLIRGSHKANKDLYTNPNPPSSPPVNPTPPSSVISPQQPNNTISSGQQDPPNLPSGSV
jgi:S1-C subfamily serine protease